MEGIVGLAKALAICQKERVKESLRLEKIQKKLITELKKISGVTINGPENLIEVELQSQQLQSQSPTSGIVRSATSSEPEVVLRTIPSIVNFSVAGLEGEQLVIELDAKGFAVSSGSACSHNNGEGSYSIRAIGGSEEQATDAVRISLPREVSSAEIALFIKSLKDIITKYKKVDF